MGEMVRSMERRIWLGCVLVFSGIAVAAAFGIVSFNLLPGVACGAVIICVNFFLGRKILEKLFTSKEIDKLFVVHYVLRFFGLAVVIFLVAQSGWFDMIGFLIGLTALLFGILIDVLWRTLYPAE
ncbi:MAG: ATP synthase subunit I [Syntrophorhabdaceae bacterium]|nr:ATP synthase subunit I [Syntrophorhabdaceae bacterium]